MTKLHVIYRQEPGETEHWATYSYPLSIYAYGATLPQARAQFGEAVGSVLADDLADCEIIEHVEKPLFDGAFIRTAIDRRTLDRDETARAFHTTLAERSQLDDFVATAPRGASGDAVVVACVAEDTVGWLTEQMGDHDGLSVCLAAPGLMVWWSYIAGRHADVPITSTETLADGGLTGESTISDFVRHSPKRAGSMAGRPGWLISA